jgi:hypothetical protein
MSLNSTHTIERIARVLAGERISINAEGADPSAGERVDSTWPEYCAEAVAVLKSLRDPPPEIAAVADRETWSRAIAAALGEDASHAESEHSSPLQEAADSVGHFFRAPS